MSDRFTTQYTEGTGYPSGRHAIRTSRENYLTVCVPVYNGEKNILRCLESVKSQRSTFDNFELIIVDNCSTDSTFDIALKFAEENEWATVYKNDNNVGRTNNWNVGLELSLDSKYHKPIMVNDYLLPNCLKTFAQYFDENPKAVIMHVTQVGYAKIHTLPHGKGPVIKEPKDVMVNFLIHNVAAGPTTYAHAMGPVKEHKLRYRAEMPIAGDYEMMAVLASFGEFIFLEDELVFFDEHEPSRTHYSIYLKPGRELESLREECICRITPFLNGYYPLDPELLAVAIGIMQAHLRHKSGVSAPADVAERIFLECLDMLLPALSEATNLSEILESVSFRFKRYVADKLNLTLDFNPNKDNVFLASPIVDDNTYGHLGKSLGLNLGNHFNFKFGLDKSIQNSQIINQDEFDYLVKSSQNPMGVKESTCIQVSILTHYRRFSAKNISFFSWETDRMARTIAGYTVDPDVLLVPNSFCKNILLSAGVKENRIFEFPIPVNLDVFTPEGSKLDSFNDKFNIITMCGLSIRSGIEDVIHSYLAAFKNTSNTRLIILPREEEYNVQLLSQKIKALRERYKNETAEIALIPKVLTDETKASLLRSCHLAVSAYKGEGADHNLLNAAAVGTPIAITGWGGPASEFSEEEVTYIDYKMQEVPEITSNALFKTITTVDRGHLWAIPDKKHLAEIMRDALRNQDKYKVKAQKLAERMRSRTYSNSIQVIKEAIASI
jgi:glycosyltransferase involved in cell wall biosynthesis